MRLAIYVMSVGLVATLATAAQAKALTISCERDSKHHTTFVIDFDNKTVHHDTGPNGPVSYTVPARISENEIRWQWTVVDYKLDRYTGILIDGGDRVDKVTWHCQTRKREIE